MRIKYFIFDDLSSSNLKHADGTKSFNGIQNIDIPRYMKATTYNEIIKVSFI